MILVNSLKYTPVKLTFGTSGLRGLVSDMTDLECYINTLGFIEFLKTYEKQIINTVYIAGDLRESTPRIMEAVAQAVTDSDLSYVNCGLIPTPALAFYAQINKQPCIMVTGSHIPADRNGIKFYKSSGEILKGDEDNIHKCVSSVRSRVYAESNLFNEQGGLIKRTRLTKVVNAAKDQYFNRYINAFGVDSLKGVNVVMYQHSAVGRDLIVDILKKLGAKVTPVGRSDVFVPIDSENITAEDQEYFNELAHEHRVCDAIISTDGDSDRPFLIDEKGVFNRGDVLGLPTTEYLGTKAVALPISSNDAVTNWLVQHDIKYSLTKIGSPYVIDAMDQLLKDHSLVSGWEVNGGYLLGSDIDLSNGLLARLPTRDAFLPIVATLLLAKQKHLKISDLFSQYPKRFTQAGLIDNFPNRTSKKIVELLSRASSAKRLVEQAKHKFPILDDILEINATDGVRLSLKNNSIIHVRPSGNAPQLRIYSNADSQATADNIVTIGIREPDGLLRYFESLV